MIHKHIIPQNIAERALNITSILNNFKPFIKQLYQKHDTLNIKKKKDRNNYFGAKISQKEEQLLRLKVKKRLIFNNRENLLFFLKSNFCQSKFARKYMSYEKLAIVFHISTLKLF